MIAFNRPQPVFEIGQLVVHRRYNYRGVVVACDDECQAPDEWYQANKTQPDRHQPWYHVLVHGSSKTTYVAERNLVPAADRGPIEHPLLDTFFTHLEGGAYAPKGLH